MLPSCSVLFPLPFTGGGKIQTLHNIGLQDGFSVLLQQHDCSLMPSYLVIKTVAILCVEAILSAIMRIVKFSSLSKLYRKRPIRCRHCIVVCLLYKVRPSSYWYTFMFPTRPHSRAASSTSVQSKGAPTMSMNVFGRFGVGGPPPVLLYSA